MDTITIPKTKLKLVIKESVREVLSQELMKLRALASPFISQKEQEDIKKRYVKPSRKEAKTIAIEI